MTELMNQMAELLEAARRQGIADALEAVRSFAESLGPADPEDPYFDGLADAIITIEKL